MSLRAQQLLLAFILGLVLMLMVGQASAHEWYSGQRNPATGWSCCGGNDCARIEESSVERGESNGVDGYFVDIPILAGHAVEASLATSTVRAFIPADQALPSRDGDYHACYWNNAPRCFFMPLGY